jgi:hypothetical protein
MSLSFSETPDHIVIPTRVSLSGYGDVLLSSVSNTSLAAGVNNLLLGAVPAGKLYVYTNIVIMYVGTVTGVTLIVQIVDGGSYYYVFGQVPPVTLVPYDRQGQWVLKVGQYLKLYIGGATLNDDAYLYATGHVVDLT